MLETILGYGQMISLFAVFIIMEGVISAKTVSPWPGLIFAFGMIAFSVFMGIAFDDIHFFGYMMVPTALCFVAYFVTRWNRRKNIEKGLHYNEDGLIEEEMNDMKRF
ncbi:hypothetical protein [Anaerotignum sp.]